MSVFKNGASWRAQFSINGRRFDRTFPARAQAEDYEQSVRREFLSTTSITFGELSELALKARERRGVKHIKKEQNILNCIFRESNLYSREAKKITTKELTRYIERVSAKNLARSSVVHRLRMIKAVLSFAVQEDFIKTNAAREVVLPRSFPQPRKWRFLSLEEIKRLLNECRTDDEIAFYSIAIYAGLRKSEILHLRWCFVDFENELIKVRAPLKTQAAERDLPMLPPVFNSLKKISNNKKDFVFGKGDKPLNPNYDFKWRDKRDKTNNCFCAGIRTRAKLEDVRFHDLRHTFCSHLISGSFGVAFTIREVAIFAGHSHVSVTERYAHLSEDSPQQKMKKLAQNWSQSH